MRSNATARLYSLYKSMLQQAIYDKNDTLIKQYWQGLIYIKTEHIKALEYDLKTMQLRAKYGHRKAA